jgi:anti-sigma B factor antagonist
MTVNIERDDHVCRFRIDGEMTIYTAAEHKSQLLDHLDDCEELELDLSGVGEMDSAGLQILLVLKREMEKAGHSLRLTNHSQAVFEVLELLKMQAHFGDPVVIPADWKTS